MHDTKTAFVGRITTSPAARNAAFRVKLYVTDHTVEIISADGDEWSWNLSDVAFERVSADRIHLLLDDEELYFLPVDMRGFLTDVVEKHSDAPLEPHRGWLRRRIEAAQAEGGQADGYDLSPTDVPDQPPATKKRHVHEWSNGSAVGVITRRCVGCGQVSIDATGVTSTLESELQTA